MTAMSNTGKEYFLALGEALSLDAKPDEDGNCLLAVDNQLPVIVRANESAERMELTASVADALPEGLAYSDMLDLLGIALGPLFNAPGIGREPGSGAIVLYATMPFATTSTADFAEAVPAFIDLANNITSRLAAIPDA